MPSMPHEPGDSRAQSRHSEALRDRGRGRPPAGGRPMGNSALPRKITTVIPYRGRSRLHMHAASTHSYTRTCTYVMHMHKCEYTFINVNPTGRLQSHGGRGRVASRAGGRMEAVRPGAMSRLSEPGDSRANSEAAGERGGASAGMRRLHLRDAAPPAGAAQPPRRGHQPIIEQPAPSGAAMAVLSISVPRHPARGGTIRE